MRLTVVLVIIITPLLATSEGGHWKKLKVKSYSSQQKKYLNRSQDGKTSYGTNIFQEGVAADKLYYPKGTMFYVAWDQNGKRKGRWFTVDDSLAQTAGKQGIIYLRFMTKKSANSWKNGNYNVYVKLPKK